MSREEEYQPHPNPAEASPEELVSHLRYWTGRRCDGLPGHAVVSNCFCGCHDGLLGPTADTLERLLSRLEQAEKVIAAAKPLVEGSKARIYNVKKHVRDKDGDCSECLLAWPCEAVILEALRTSIHEYEEEKWIRERKATKDG